jgi:hypothetical protein
LIARSRTERRRAAVMIMAAYPPRSASVGMQRRRWWLNGAPDSAIGNLTSIGREHRTHFQGLVTTATRLGARILIDIGDIRQFRTPAQLAAYAGLGPTPHQSGTSLRGNRATVQSDPRERLAA